MFREEEQAQDYIAKVMEAGRRAIAAGTEVLFLTGSTAVLLASRKVFAIDDVPLLHSYGLLVKAAEGPLRCTASPAIASAGATTTSPSRPIS